MVYLIKLTKINRIKRTYPIKHRQNIKSQRLSFFNYSDIASEYHIVCHIS